ncbi:MAG TPA: hypothetical protein DCK95_11850 [Anaerolineaceae bacterium]|uniref:Archease domain-containing protein n=1 Tax=Anaerolinea thermophila TaxID=167964 RepID=A0A124FN11_9CHLR|nr:MAG: hypothetical protein XD73_0689 [Anaerolinea thermophila]HAF63000.1 hypothetical protein [Anaerolineaceae bacterium]
MTCTCGFKEIEHTADIAVEVWGDSIQVLFNQAAMALYAIAAVQMIDGIESSALQLDLKGTDIETLLVAFLSELLYYLDDGIFFTNMQITITECSLNGELSGGRKALIGREVKAITYHDLDIQLQDDIYRTRIVFDV